MKPKVRNIVLWVLTTLFILAVIIGILCWTGVIPSTFLTAPIRKMTNGLMGVLLLGIKDMFWKTAKRLLLNPLFYLGVCLGALLRLKRPPPYYAAYDKFYRRYIYPPVIRFKKLVKGGRRTIAEAIVGG